MKITYYIILANIIVFISYMIFPPIADVLALDPIQALSGSYWQFITYMFVHGNIELLQISPGAFLNSGLFHIAINMFVLLIFGTVVERELGGRIYLEIYLISGIGSAILHMLFITMQFGYLVNIGLVGASGAIFGILAIYGIFYPKNWIIIFPGIPLPAAVAVIGIAGFELFAGFTGIEPGIANFGHVGGLIIGILFAVYWRFMRKRKPMHGEFEFMWE